MSEKSDKILKELGYEPAKTKTPQPQISNEAQGRDMFQTPNYAVDLLIPFIPKYITQIWECAFGEGKISRRLAIRAYWVWCSDIRARTPFNFLTDVLPEGQEKMQAIITNPPFSLKEKFYKKCLEYELPFALLIPADYSGWIIEACQNGAEKIIPTRRIDYLTPNILWRIHEGEIWKNSKEFYPDFKGNLKTFKMMFPDSWEKELSKFDGYCLWDSIDEVPRELLVKYSSSDFHSMWLTKGFNLGKTETFVELSIKEKKENI